MEVQHKTLRKGKTKQHGGTVDKRKKRNNDFNCNDTF